MSTSQIVYISGLDSDYDMVEICNLKLDISPDKVIRDCIPHDQVFLLFL